MYVCIYIYIYIYICIISSVHSSIIIHMIYSHEPPRRPEARSAFGLPLEKLALSAATLHYLLLCLITIILYTNYCNIY